MVSVTTIIGVGSGVAGIVMFLYQVCKKRKLVQSLEQEKQELKKEREELKVEKDEYEKIVDDVKTIIQDMQSSVNNGRVNEKQLMETLNKLEKTVLPKQDIILSKLSRIQNQISKQS